MEYNFREIEKKWQQRWVDNKTYQVKEDETKQKYYVLNMFPYPSGAGLHVGHPLGYIASDIYARYKRLQGFNVLNPMGYDAYGLPAEQYAIQTGQHPEVTTRANINRYREQLDKIGFSFDWNREIKTCDPEYYQWTQWAFQQMFNSFYCNACQSAKPISKLVEHFAAHGTEGLDVACSEELTFTADEWNAKSEKEQQETLMNYRIAYLGETMVNWCPALGTVLANDEVVDGVSERGGHPVVQKKMRQWCLRVSAYAQRLLDGLDTIDWTDSLKETQRNWIGRSEGAEIRFKVAKAPSNSPRGGESHAATTNSCSVTTSSPSGVVDGASGAEETSFTIFTTRADTMFGVTFMVLAPESELVPQLTTPEQKAEVDAYLERTKKRTERERISDRSVTGVFSGSYAINPFTGNAVPIWISDYVLAGYGTGAIMAVPAHDSRDYAFAKHFNLPIIPLVEGCDVSEESFDAKEGIVCNSPAPSNSPRGGESHAATTNSCSVTTSSPSGVVDGAASCSVTTSSPSGVVDGAASCSAATSSPSGGVEGAPLHPVTTSSPSGGVDGALVLNGLTIKEAIAATKKYVKEHGLGRVKVNYRLRDAIFSRQRYWGEPFPVYYKEGMPYMIPAECLPLELPEVSKFLPTETGEPPLGNATCWAWDTQNNCVVENSKIDNVTIFPLELNTMPGFAGSSAYYLRYMDPRNHSALVDKKVDEYWKCVDLYVGGTEHATGHLIYSRFWNKFLKDIGVSAVEEPFQKLVNQGMIQGRSNFVYRIKDTNTFVSLGLKDQYDTTPLHVDVNIVSNDVLDVEAFKAWRPEYATAEFILEAPSNSPRGGESHAAKTNSSSAATSSPSGGVEGAPLHPVTTSSPSGGVEGAKYICGWAVEKMSKSMFNVVNPDMIVEKYGADTLRMYEMFLGPVEQSKPWDTNGIDGVHRFLKKFWSLFYDRSGQYLVTDEPATREELKSLHKLIKKVTGDIETFSYNTSISAFMICVNELASLKCYKKEVLQQLVIVLAPFAPHVCEELNEKLNAGNSPSRGDEGVPSVCDAQWPKWNEEYLVENSVNYTISFNGKARFNMEFPADAASDAIQTAVLADERSAKWMEGKSLLKVIVVPKKIVNIVLKN